MAVTITHNKTLLAPDSGVEDKVYGSDYVAADSHNMNGLGTGVEAALEVNVGSAGAVVVNGGALGTPSSGTLTNATGLPVGGISATGTPGAGNFLRGDGTWAAASGSSTWDTIGAAAGDGSTNNGTNRIVYNTAPTADSRIAWRFSESTAASGGTSTSGVPNQVLLQLDTLASSTQSPLKVLSRGSHVFSVSPTTAQILAADGLQSAPSYSFAGMTNTGLWMNGTTEICLSFNNTNTVRFRASQSRFAPGTVSAPSLTEMDLAANSGIYWPAGNTVAVACTSREVVRWKPASTGGGWQIMDEADSDPTTTELDANDSVAMYNKNNKLVFAFNNAGTITYISIPMDGSSTTWTQSTTAP